VRLLRSGLSLLLALCFVTSEAAALSEDYRRCFARELRFIVGKNPKYVWGGASDLERGVDCSGYVFLAAKWAGIPGIKRTTAFRMALGIDGWSASEILPEQAQECDLPFWTWSTNPTRINGHVGVFLREQSGLAVAHASERRGVVLEPWEGKLRTDLSKVMRLIIGD